MSRNVEIKARIESADAWAAKIAALAGADPVDIAQDDTFFRCDAARLKLRAQDPREAARELWLGAQQGVEARLVDP